MTLRRLEESARAASDIEIAAGHYRALAGADSAFAFIQSLEAVYALIAEHPDIGSPRYGHALRLPKLRHHKLARYPWLVFYVVEPDVIVIVRVLDGRRDIPAALLEDEGAGPS